MKIGFIGHREVKKPHIEIKIEKLLDYFDNEDVNEFVYGSNSKFDDLCYECGVKIRGRNDNIILTNFCCSKIGVEHRFFDNIIYPKECTGAGRLLYFKRNKAMIDYCDLLIFYFDENYKPALTNSGTKIAYDYARSLGKKIVNLFYD